MICSKNKQDVTKHMVPSLGGIVEVVIKGVVGISTCAVTAQPVGFSEKHDFEPTELHPIQGHHNGGCHPWL